MAYQKKTTLYLLKKKINEKWNKSWNKNVIQTMAKNSQERFLQEEHRLHLTETRPSRNIKSYNRTHETHHQHVYREEPRICELCKVSLTVGPRYFGL